VHGWSRDCKLLCPADSERTNRKPEVPEHQISRHTPVDRKWQPNEPTPLILRELCCSAVGELQFEWRVYQFGVFRTHIRDRMDLVSSSIETSWQQWAEPVASLFSRSWKEMKNIFPLFIPRFYYLLSPRFLHTVVYCVLNRLSHQVTNRCQFLFFFNALRDVLTEALFIISSSVSTWRVDIVDQIWRISEHLLECKEWRFKRHIF